MSQALPRVLAICLPLFPLFSAAGCAGTAYPQLLNPPPVNVQQQRAERFDPFPEVGSGPDITGGRPRGFENPSPEPVRTQTNANRVLRSVPGY